MSVANCTNGIYRYLLPIILHGGMHLRKSTHQLSCCYQPDLSSFTLFTLPPFSHGCFSPSIACYTGLAGTRVMLLAESTSWLAHAHGMLCRAFSRFLIVLLGIWYWRKLHVICQAVTTLSWTGSRGVAGELESLSSLYYSLLPTVTRLPFQCLLIAWPRVSMSLTTNCPTSSIKITVLWPPLTWRGS